MTTSTTHQGKKSAAFKYNYLGLDASSIKDSILSHLTYTVGKDQYTATEHDWLHAVVYAVRDRLSERWMETMRTYYNVDTKRVYYLSMEFLLGRHLQNGLLNLGIEEECKEAVQQMSQDLSQLEQLEFDAALGNGGLGRLAACFLDSMATLRLPGYGYGIRYEYGMFSQRIENGCQVEHPDNWLRYGNPWEFQRPEVIYIVKFYGRVVPYTDTRGSNRFQWVETDDVCAMAYDTPIPGYHTNTVNNLRLWSAKATRDFHLKYFNEGNYIDAVADKNESEIISKVLYPDDSTELGRELRLKQEYFFVSASLQDVIYRYKKYHDTFDELSDKVAIQLNDTHPAIAIPELMRILMDDYGVEWSRAWETTRNTFAYTNHTLMPEALETWPVSLLERMLPRHLQIIYEINAHFLRDVIHHYPGDIERLRRMSLIHEEGERRVRMAHLAVVGSHKVNGVSAIHTELLRTYTFKDFHEFFPGKLINKTNGITPRRWLNQANPNLAALITKKIGQNWTTNLDQLRKLLDFAHDQEFQQSFRAVKQANKARLAEIIQRKHLIPVEINLNAIFDVQIKRIHEYKRQLLNVLHVITRYNRIRQNPAGNHQPRVVIFGGKAAPGYGMAKLVIKLINEVADTINNDPVIAGRLQVVFYPNYDVSSAQNIIPAAELSEQISTAGTEASGTGNMKFSLNGALTIGTLDGANIEIMEQVGRDNIFIFGLTTEQVSQKRREGYNPWDYYHSDGELKQTLDMLASGYFFPEKQGIFKPIFDLLTNHGDYYLLLADYRSYIECQDRVDALYRNPEAWACASITNVANMGFFSSDRTITDYANDIWGIRPITHD